MLITHMTFKNSNWPIVHDWRGSKTSCCYRKVV